MATDELLRRIERLGPDGQWAEVEMRDIRRGDRFRMWEGDTGAPVRWNEQPDGAVEFLATDDASERPHADCADLRWTVGAVSVE
jgi:hypothetical protein